MFSALFSVTFFKDHGRSKAFIFENENEKVIFKLYFLSMRVIGAYRSSNPPRVKVNLLTHLWGPSLVPPSTPSDSVLGGLWPSALLHSDFWVCTQPAWSSRRQHAVSRSCDQNVFLSHFPDLWIITVVQYSISIVLQLSATFFGKSYTVWKSI